MQSDNAAICGCDDNCVGPIDTSKELKILGLAVVLALFGWLATAQNQISFILFACAVLLAGWDVYKEAFAGLRSGSPLNEQFLMSIASIGACLLQEYPEAVAVMVFYRIGELVQGRAVGRARRAIDTLLAAQPDQAPPEHCLCVCC